MIHHRQNLAFGLEASSTATAVHSGLDDLERDLAALVCCSAAMGHGLHAPSPGDLLEQQDRCKGLVLRRFKPAWLVLDQSGRGIGSDASVVRPASPRRRDRASQRLPWASKSAPTRPAELDIACAGDVQVRGELIRITCRLTCGCENCFTLSTSQTSTDVYLLLRGLGCQPDLRFGSLGPRRYRWRIAVRSTRAEASPTARQRQ